MTKTNAQVDLQAEVAAINGTSKKIRYLAAAGKSRGETEKLLYQWGVRTANGTPIRYQHIRNVLITPLTGK